MKKNAIIFLSLLLISLITAAPSLNFQHEETQSGETILATIITTGEFTKQIEPSDITFYDGRKKIFFESDITFYDGIHYLYVYTTRQGNFSIQIADILYKEAEEIKSNTITSLFNITDKIITDKETNEISTEILSIKPGFIFTTESPEIKLTNAGTTILNLTYNKIKLSLEPSETQKIDLDPTEVFSYLNISTYKKFSIPIIYPTLNATFESPLVQLDLRPDHETLLVELFTNNKTQKTIQLFNFGDKNITDIQATCDLSFVKIEQLEDIQTRGVQNLTITFNPKNPGHFQNYINITYIQYLKQNTFSIPLSLFILPKGSDTGNFETSKETCEELSGIVCNSKEICNGDAIFTKNGEYCCFGLCQSTTKDKSETNFGWLIALIIFAVLGGGGYYLYKRQKKIKPKKPKEQMKDSSDKFDKRMKGIPETKRISGALTKS